MRCSKVTGISVPAPIYCLTRREGKQHRGLLRPPLLWFVIYARRIIIVSIVASCIISVQWGFNYEYTVITQYWYRGEFFLCIFNARYYGADCLFCRSPNIRNLGEKRGRGCVHGRRSQLVRNYPGRGGTKATCVSFLVSIKPIGSRGHLGISRKPNEIFH